MKRHTSLAAALALALGAGACADLDPGANPVAPAASTTTTTTTESSAEEKRALTDLTRLTAQALGNPGLRQRVRNDLRDSRHTVEHKLELAAYLKGQSGGILLAAMAAESGRSREEILGVVARVRALEFYMPVAAHRATWRGGEGLWVASYLEDDGREAPAVFAAGGAPVALWAPDQEPAVPTLALVPVETNFSRPLNRATARNKDSNGGETIGTYEVPGDPVCIESVDDRATASCGGTGGDTGGSAPPPALPSGLWMTYAYGDEGVPDGTWGLKGQPEIEMHVFALDPNNPSQAISSACSYADASGYRRFDMNDHEWSSYNGVLLFSQEEINTHYGRTSQDFSVQMWEDDDTTCKVKTDYNLTQFFEDLLAIYGANAIKVQGYTIFNGRIVAMAIALSNWIQGNDDFVGEAQPVAAGTLPNYATHRLQRPGRTNNGRVRLITR